MDSAFIPTAEKILDFLEKYRDVLSCGPDGRGPLWKEFKTYICRERNEDTDGLLGFLCKGVNLEDSEAINARLKTKSECYKFVLALRSPRGSSNDTRVQDIFKMAVKRSVPIKVGMLKARFMSSASSRGKGAPPTKMTQYNTEPATTFELVFFFVGLCYTTPTDDRGHKKRRKSIRGNSQRHRDYGQAIGFAVQSVIRAWDNFADILKFCDAQELVSPYIQFDGDACVYNPLEDRENGFALSRQSHTLQDIEGATQVEEKCNQRAWRRDTQYDQDLRSLAHIFLSDIYSLITEEDIFQDSEEGTDLHPKLLQFIERECFLDLETTLEKRFKMCPQDVIDRVRNAREREVEDKESDEDMIAKEVDEDTIPTEVDASSSGFPKFQQLPEYIIRFAGGMNDRFLPISGSEIPFSSWERRLRKFITEVPTVSLAACEMSNLGLHVTDFGDYMKGKVIASKGFSRGDYVGPIFGYLVYHDLNLLTSFSRMSIDGKEELSLSLSDFKWRSVKLFMQGRAFMTLDDEVTTYWNDAWVVPCKFCVCGYIRKLSNLRMRLANGEGDENESYFDVVNKESNVEIRLMEDTFLTMASITDPFAVRVFAKEGIKAGDEIVLG